MTTELAKKLIVTANVSKLSEDKFVEDTKAKTKAQITNPTIVPDLEPEAAPTLVLIEALETKLSQRKTAKAAIKQMTTDIKSARKDITDIMVSDWAPQIQAAVGDDVGKVQLLLFGVKNVDDGHAEEEYTFDDSRPLIKKIDISISGQHTLSIINDPGNFIRLPRDVKQIHVYGIASDSMPPANLKKFNFLGIAQKGKFTYHFSEEEMGKTMWYVAVYIQRQTLMTGELSGTVRANAV